MKKLDGVEDLRVRRTRKLLQQALIEGTVKKGFAAEDIRSGWMLKQTVRVGSHTNPSCSLATMLLSTH